MYLLRTNQLRYNYKKKNVLDGIDLLVPENSIYGFLGKNGAGKTTTIKLLLGLLRSKNNTIFYYNTSLEKNRINILKNTGHLTESACFYDNLTAYENLKYIDCFYKRGNKRIIECLNIVNLNNQVNEKVKYFSTGMRQRLGIAIAIFHDPSFVILDEPLNGLDPEGIHDVRSLILQLRSLGKTILLSSHVLGEVDKVCSNIGIINNGKIVFQGNKQDLLKNSESKILITVDDTNKSLMICKDNKLKATFVESNRIEVLYKDSNIGDILSLFLNNNVKIIDIAKRTIDIESIFLSKTCNKVSKQ